MNCKPGDLAIVVRDLFAENIGRVVEIVGPAKFVTDAPAWHCITRGQPLRVLWIDRAPETYLCTKADAYDSDLKPITGLPIDEDVTEDLKEPA